MNLWKRTCASLDKRGVAGTVLVGFKRLPGAVVRWRDDAFDRRYSTRTIGIVELDTLDIDGNNRSRGIRYEPTLARPLRELFRRIELPVQDGFVDIGCGKGRVLVIAAEYGFRHVAGIEFSGALCEAARTNLACYQSASGDRLTTTVLHADAADATIDDAWSVFYMFNPFDDVVMARVAENLRTSLARKPRKIWLIYYNPRARSVLDDSGLFTRSHNYTISDCDFIVYQN